MRFHKPALIIFVVSVCILTLTACGQTATGEGEKSYPAILENNEETGLNRITLTEKAAERLGIETAAVEEKQVEGSRRKVIPYSSLIYDFNGGTWVYINPEPLIFIREQVVVESIQGDLVILMDGPENGTEVVITGVAELYGTDTGVGK